MPNCFNRATLPNRFSSFRAVCGPTPGTSVNEVRNRLFVLRSL